MSSCASIFISVTPSKRTDVAIVLKSNTGQEAILTNDDLLKSQSKGRIQIHGAWVRVNPSFRNKSISSSSKNYNPRLSIPALLSLTLPSATLLSAIVTYFITNAKGWDAVFPSYSTVEIVWKLTIWCALITLTIHEQWHYWYGGFNSTKDRQESDIGLEIQIEEESSITMNTKNLGRTTNSSGSLAQIMYRSFSENDNNNDNKNDNINNDDIKSTSSIQASLDDVEVTESPNQQPAAPIPTVSKDTPPFRFIRAAKGDIVAAKVRWSDTLKWREQLGMNTILNEPHPNLALIKENYPHYFHNRGRKNECCYYEKPPKMNLKIMREAGIELDDILRHYALCCEYMWCNIDPSEDGKSIYIIDLEGMGLRDFAGDVVDFVKKASAFTGAHYPERSGSIFVVNVPSWFSIIWNVVRSMVDEVTKEKITILRVGKAAITKALVEKIPIENIPEEYGGTSGALGSSPEEEKFINHFTSLGE